MQRFEHIAQSIVEQFSSILNIPISITDDTGIIIGCTDSHRLGTHHVATAEVTKSGKVMFFSKEQSATLNNVLPGVATPLQFQQQTIGVLGLIGEPKDVERYVSFVQAHIEMLLMERFRSKTVGLQMDTLKDFSHHLLTYKTGKDVENLYSYAEMLGISLSLPRRCIFLEIPLASNQTPFPSFQNAFNKIQQDLFLFIRSLLMDNENDIVAPLNAQQWIILKHVQTEDTGGLMKKLDYAFHSLKRFVESRDLESSIIISFGNCYSTIEGVIHSYEQSRKALAIAKRHHFTESIISIEDWKLLSLALIEETELPARQTLDQYVEKLNNHPNGAALISSFIVYCEEQLNMSQAAKKLFIHRNTLIYRLQQLQELLSIDFQSFHQCVLLYLALKQHENAKLALPHTLEQP